MAKRERLYLDGTYFAEVENGDVTEVIEVELTLRDTLNYERMEKKSPMAGVAEQGMIPQLAVMKLVWLAARRKGLTEARRYEDFERKVLDVWAEVEDEGEDGDLVLDDSDEESVHLPDPTQSAHTDD